MRIIRFTSARRHPLGVVAGSAIVVVVVAVLLGDVAGHARILHTLRNVRPEWFGLCLAAQALSYLGYVFALRETAHVDDGPRLGFRHAAGVVAAGFGAFFSASRAGGFGVDYRALRHAGADRRDAFTRVIGLGTLEYAILALGALGSAIFILTDGQEHIRDSMTWPWLAVVPGVTFGIWVTQPSRARRWIKIRPGDGRIRRSTANAIAGLTVLRRLILQPRAHGMAFVGTAMYWFGEILCLWAALMAFHARVGVPVLIIGFATGYVLTRRSLPAGGAGISEVGLTFALYWLDVPFASALLGVLAYRAFNFWLALVPAFAARGTMRTIHAEFAETDAELRAERVGLVGSARER